MVCTQTSVVTPANSRWVIPCRRRDVTQCSGVERTLAGLYDDGFARDGRQFGDNVVARFAVDENAAHFGPIADAQAGIAAQALCGWAVGKVRAMRFAGMNHTNAVAATVL